MKRLLWLPGPLIGAVALPLLMSGALLVFLKVFNLPLSPLNFTDVFPQMMTSYGIFGAALGTCSIMLLGHYRTLVWRILGTLCGLVSAVQGAWKVWSEFHDSSALYLTSITHTRYLVVTFQAPLLLWGLTIFFFALLLRSPSNTNTPSLKS